MSSTIALTSKHPVVGYGVLDGPVSPPAAVSQVKVTVMGAPIGASTAASETCARQLAPEEARHTEFGPPGITGVAVGVGVAVAVGVGVEVDAAGAGP
jgi:hypothetical protein